MCVKANTWGSGLYFIFHSVDDCAEFSLHLLTVVAKMDWLSLGLPLATACLGMHGGPLFPGYNPVRTHATTQSTAEQNRTEQTQKLPARHAKR